MRKFEIDILDNWRDQNRAEKDGAMVFVENRLEGVLELRLLDGNFVAEDQLAIFGADADFYLLLEAQALVLFDQIGRAHV